MAAFHQHNTDIYRAMRPLTVVLSLHPWHIVVRHEIRTLKIVDFGTLFVNATLGLLLAIAAGHFLAGSDAQELATTTHRKLEQIGIARTLRWIRTGRDARSKAPKSGIAGYEKSGISAMCDAQGDVRPPSHLTVVPHTCIPACPPHASILCLGAQRR